MERIARPPPPTRHRPPCTHERAAHPAGPWSAWLDPRPRKSASQPWCRQPGLQGGWGGAWVRGGVGGRAERAGWGGASGWPAELGHGSAGCLGGWRLAGWRAGWLWVGGRGRGAAPRSPSHTYNDDLLAFGVSSMTVCRGMLMRGTSCTHVMQVQAGRQAAWACVRGERRQRHCRGAFAAGPTPCKTQDPRACPPPPPPAPPPPPPHTHAAHAEGSVHKVAVQRAQHGLVRHDAHALLLPLHLCVCGTRARASERVCVCVCRA